MGNCCTKQSLKSSPSNSFTNLKFGPNGERKPSAKSPSGKTRHKSGESVKGKKDNLPPINKVLSQPQNGHYTENLPHQPASDQGKPTHYVKPPSPKYQEPIDENGRTPSYRLRQADLRSDHEQTDGDSGSKTSSIDRATPTSQLTGDRAGSLRLEQQLLHGHRRSGSNDFKKGHNRNGSNTNNIVRDRSDSQQRVHADYIRKGNWALHDPKLKRGDSSDKKDYSPVSARNTNTQPILTQPSILVDHCANSNVGQRLSPSPVKSSIPPPTSPSMTRSDSCKNELNPMLRNKPHLQERRQVVSAITINTAACNDGEFSPISDGRRRSSDFTAPTNQTDRDPKSNQQLACVLKWKKGNLLGRGTFGKVKRISFASMNVSVGYQCIHIYRWQVFVEE